MKIKNIRAYKVDLGLSKPYTVAYETNSTAENVFLEVELENGIIGYGAACPSEFVFGEKMEDTVSNLTSDALQKWIGKDIRCFRSLILESRLLFPLHSATRTAVDIALHDAFGKFIDIPVYKFYGGQVRKQPTSVTIGILGVDETIREASEFKKLGFKILKVKTGLNPKEDVERIIKLKETYGNYFKIRVDANQGYSIEETKAFYESTIELGIELIEQPVSVKKVRDLKLLPSDVRKKIACDESLTDKRSALDLAGENICGIFNIKLMKCGGLLEAFDISSIAEAYGIEIFWGCYDESIASITAALHASLACPTTKYLDLDGSFDLADDIFEGGFTLIDGELIPNEKSGFGFWRV